MADILTLLNIIIWPITILLILLLFRRQIISLSRLIDRVEAPGGFKVILDREKVEEIIKEGRRENTSAEELAKQIETSAQIEVMDTLELRVLRALFDEDKGRLMANYERYYQSAIKTLLDKGYIEKRENNYFLTKAGSDVTKKYLMNIMVKKNT
jgi:hypothetical protein